jgi:hypothetical protein
MCALARITRSLLSRAATSVTGGSDVQEVHVTVDRPRQHQGTAEIDPLLAADRGLVLGG